MTKIDIYSGFLGAGKTTLIKKMIQEGYQNEKLVLIENEFGEIGIDGGFLQDAGVNITEMNSGCICCSLVGDFGKALEQVISDYHPDRVIIEPSGVGKLSDVIGAVRKVVSQDVALGNTVAVADVGKVKVYLKNFGEFYANQIETASTIVLSRTDSVPQAKLDAAVALLREHNGKATIVTTPWPQLTGAQLLAALEGQATLAQELARLEEAHKHHHHHHHQEEGECCCGHHHGEHHHHHHEEGECSCGHHHGEHHHHHHEEGECSCGHHHEEQHHHHHEEGECSCGHHHEEQHHHHEACHAEHFGDDHCHRHHHGHEDKDHCCHHGHHHDHGEHCGCGHHHGEHHHHDHEGHCSCGHDHHHHDHHADEVFTSWGVETARKFTLEVITAALKALDTGDYGMVLRAKGIVPAADGSWIHFDYVPGEHNVRLGGADITGKLCVIGAQLDEAKVARLFGV